MQWSRNGSRAAGWAFRPVNIHYCFTAQPRSKPHPKEVQASLPPPNEPNSQDSAQVFSGQESVLQGPAPPPPPRIGPPDQSRATPPRQEVADPGLLPYLTLDNSAGFGNLRAQMKKKKSETSRQYRWQVKQMAQGRCARCGSKRSHYSVLCDSCHLADRVRQHERSGSRPWKKGLRGRPPKVMLPLKQRVRR